MKKGELQTELDAAKTLASTYLADLMDKGYDQGACWRYAKAAKSWAPKGSVSWLAWAEVELQTVPADRD